MESDSMTPSVLRYSDQIPQMAPQMDFNYNVMIPSNGSTFSPSQEVRIPINVPADSFVDMKRAYLKFKLNNTTATVHANNAMQLDPTIGGAAVIDTFRVVSGTGALLEETQHYNALVSVMRINQNEGVRASRGSLTEGSSATPLTAKSQSTIAGDTVGNGVFGRQSVAAGASIILCHEPVSAVFNADKLMPFGYTQGTSYISLTLADVNAAISAYSVLNTVTSLTWTVSEFELHLPVLRPGAEFANNFRTLIQSGLPINIHSVGFQNSQQNIAAGASGMNTITFSTRKRSVKSVLCGLRINSMLTNQKCDSASCWKNNEITEYQYSVGGRRIPSAPIKVNSALDGQDLGSAYNNTLMALGHYDSNLRGSSSTRATNFGQYMQLVAADLTESSKCVFALDLESYGEGLSGMNLAGQGLPLVLHANFADSAATRAGRANAILADLYVVHDVIFTLDGVSGTMSASS